MPSNSMKYVPSPMFTASGAGITPGTAQFTPQVSFVSRSVLQWANFFVQVNIGSLTNIVVTPQVSFDGSAWFDMPWLAQTLTTTNNVAVFSPGNGFKITRLKFLATGTVGAASISVDVATQNYMSTNYGSNAGGTTTHSSYSNRMNPTQYSISPLVTGSPQFLPAINFLFKAAVQLISIPLGFTLGSLTNATFVPQLSFDQSTWFDAPGVTGAVTLTANAAQTLWVCAAGAKSIRLKYTATGTATGSSLLTDYLTMF